MNFETFQKGRCYVSSQSEEVIAGGPWWLIGKKSLSLLCVALCCAALKGSYLLPSAVVVLPGSSGFVLFWAACRAVG